MSQTTLETLTAEQIRALADEANAAGDTAAAEHCGAALNGELWARQSVVAMINAAEAQQEA